jgi:UMF1 family MFS transporter
VAGFCFYDFANSSFTTLISTVAFPVYFSRVVVGGSHADLLWSLATAAAHLALILGAPALGALADYSGRKKRFLMLTTIQTVAACALLALVGPGDVLPAFLLYAVAAVGFEGGYVFYNAFLREVSTPATIGRVSGLSWGTGFLGGLTALVACWPFLARPLVSSGTGALDPEAVVGHRISFVVVAAFFAVFSIPTFLLLRERGERRAARRVLDYAAIGFGRIRRTLRELPRHRRAARLVAAALLFTAGVETVIKFSAIYASVTFGIQGAELVALFVFANVIAVPGTLLAGWVADRLGGRRALALTLAGWFLLLLTGAATSSKAGIWILASGVAVAMGSTQAIGRSLMAQLSPADRGAEFFGFYLLSNKLGAILGLLAFGSISWVTGSQRAALLALSPCFLASLALVLSLREERPSPPGLGSA